MDEDNDGRFPDDSAVEVRYPGEKRQEQGDRSAWPWLPGAILSPARTGRVVRVRGTAGLVRRSRRRMPRETHGRAYADGPAGAGRVSLQAFAYANVHVVDPCGRSPFRAGRDERNFLAGCNGSLA